MRTPFFDLAITALLLSAAAAGAQVQDEAPTQLHTPTLNPHHTRHQDLSWIWTYAEPVPDGRENELVADPKFTTFLQTNLKAPQTFWTRREPLSGVAKEFLSVPGQVLTDSNRYLSITGCVPHFCPSRGLLWIDTGTPDPLTVFAAIDWIQDNRATDQAGATYTLWLFSSRSLTPAHVPAALVQALTRWTAQPSSGAIDLQNITRVFLVDPDGTPHTVAPGTVGAHNTLPAETSDEQKAQS